MASKDFTLKGVDKVIGNMETLTDRMFFAARQALYEEALVEQKESMKRTPVDTGALRASHITNVPEWVGDYLQTTIEVGGPAASYAVIVHEDMEADHSKRGKKSKTRTQVGQAKYLESTILESAPFMLARIAHRMKRFQAS